MTEEPKRLTPTSEVVRELYLKCGNQCAYPGCDHLMMDENGVFIGEVCHIEAAMPGGERFNKNQTNEERRSFENLLLLCHKHHKVTDNIDDYPVHRMKTIKAEHEAKFTDAISKIRSSIIDHTDLKSESLPKTLARFDKVMKWNSNESEQAESLSEITRFIRDLKRIPFNSRKLLLIMILRSEKSGWSSHDLSVPFPEIMEACHLNPNELRAHLSILEKYGMVIDGGADELGVSHIALCDLESGWPLWSDLLTFSKKIKEPLSAFIEDLRFDLLD